jgi:hypothetical protein
LISRAIACGLHPGLPRRLRRGCRATRQRTRRVGGPAVATLPEAALACQLTCVGATTTSESVIDILAPPCHPHRALITVPTGR